MSNLEEIAKLSGFSKATVSRVLNKSRHVSPSTREKILNVIREMDYVPNRNAVSLSKGKTLQIGMVTENISEIILPFMTRFVEVAAEHGFQTIIYTSDSDRTRELQAFEDLKQKRVDGLLIITCVNELSLVSSYGKYGPIVSWQRTDRPDIPSVAMDQYAGYRLAVEHLLSLGITDIANAFGRPNSLNTKRRAQAYEDLMHERGLDIRRDWYFKAVYHMESGQETVRRLLAGAGDEGAVLQKNPARTSGSFVVLQKIPSETSGIFVVPQKLPEGTSGLFAVPQKLPEGTSGSFAVPQAIICANDFVATGVLSEARRLGWDVPGELSIVGFDNMPIAETLGLTTIQNPIRDQAYNAFALLSPGLLGEQLPLKPLEFGLVVRETTQSPASNAVRGT
ncbi:MULTISPECIES: LacI family DNA-binding transcriptional regulator [Saccharibacillus]|uniref:LacI family DNA-binding transcriptional regulator n=1 Tax=Saccharibacillus TaxID=456492 RepID=UPI0012387B19|nr:LacI family DNA-binding transcriptional regulator [Saccharibacillus sp. WB 17]MWJ31794.1 LacI family DNA-binding transcriptional regulator [Saccharibacillus sp. WB 17]